MKSGQGERPLPRHQLWGPRHPAAPVPRPSRAPIARSGGQPAGTTGRTATRAITIKARPGEVWPPWLTQVGYGRAGFYSYDLLDNMGRPSAAAIMPQWQRAGVGDLAAPMTSHPTPSTSFRVAGVKPEARLVWAKPDSTWAWTFTSAGPGRTRLVTRLRQRYRPG
jgi:hypothetical protein